LTEKQLLFSVTAADCDFQYMRGTGPGGQKRNKTESKVRCVHRESGAVGESDQTRSQQQNKQIAFRKMAESEQFKKWHRLTVAKKIGIIAEIEQNVDKMMSRDNLLIEGKDEKGRWTKMEMLE
jgi:protein subunit release factor B